jgi:pSer/pThr/pTyr-binding forkhead associated (FHA) protein
MIRFFIAEEAAGGPREIQLRPGINRLGRSEDNDFPIPEDSVSSHHCEIDLAEGIATVRDLDSTNGTFLNGRLIQQARVWPGQVLCLGTVQMACHDDAAPSVVTPTAAPSLPPMPRSLVARICCPPPGGLSSKQPEL